MDPTDGKGNAGTIRWDVLTIGHLSRNKFWGESSDKAYRSPRCTCTLIRLNERTIIVDPSCPPEEMIRVLDQRTGLKAEQITDVFLTHFHGDHRYGIEAFPDARRFMARREIDHCRGQLPPDSPEGLLLDRLIPVDHSLTPGIQIVHTPGHSEGHSSLVFDSGGLTVVVAGDAAMTRDFFRARDYYFNTTDPEAAVHSIDRIAAIADIVIPGHDNYFLNQRS
ncbi:MBL fold metallo-hydrolase [Paenibacillus glycinis]|uniref:MBL fold metallo-hydrolase n=1 Tax=Paenibacillus glycinis TaxID=2697035 RepID=A0ABW9XQ10_9BACL|nr:MBL fold metallo-hydrolase [Paenibacillus glycinis]NBD24710.1 MBL fold metallo-hydrolase [Paenibacillus glycinis]